MANITANDLAETAGATAPAALPIKQGGKTMKTFARKSTAKRALKTALGKIDLTLEDINYDIMPADTLDMGEGWVARIKFDDEVPDDVETLEQIARVIYPKKKSKSGYIRGNSTIGGACAMVHGIATEMAAENPDVSRKEIIAACMAAGVTYGTARTQYQKWKENQK